MVSPFPLVTPTQLLQGKAPLSGGGGSLKYVDASWHLNKPDRDPRREHAEERIPGASWFDIDGVSDKASDLPHMLPSAEAFASACTAMGICNDDTVVVYAAEGCFSAPRVWWTFRCFGHRAVHVLDGGLPDWKAAGGPTESGPLDESAAAEEPAAADSAMASGVEAETVAMEQRSRIGRRVEARGF